MVRTSGMSRGCKTCRTRKIKCDEKLPHCSQCLKSGRECPGPVSDFIVLEATKSDPRRSRRVENDSPRSGTSSKSPAQPIAAVTPAALENATSWSGSHSYSYSEPGSGTESSTGNTLARIGRSGLELGEILASRKNLPSFQSPQHISFEPDQVERFISYFFGAGNNDTESEDCMTLRPFIVDYPSDPYLKSPLVAAALCLHANSSDDPEALLSAQRAYGSGLRWQQERLAAHKKDSTPVIQDVLSTLMLGYFEMMSCTDQNAYFHHITGAATMLGMVGPRVCSLPHWQPLFRAVRLHMVYYSFKELKNSFFASPEWMTTPFEDKPKAAIDFVIDVLTVKPEALSTSYTDINPANLENNVHVEVSKMVRALKDIWHNMQGQLPPRTDQGKGKEIRTLLSVSHAPCWYYVPKLEEYDENFSGLCIAFYCAAWMILLSRVQESSSSLDREELIAAHAFNILLVSDRMEALGNGGEFIRMVLPLRVVAMKSPREIHRESAKRQLESWRDTRALKGICTIALAG